MAFITVEDFTAVAETTIFSEPYERCRSAIEQGAIVLAKGRVEAPQNYTEGEEAVPKMIVNDVVLLTDIKGRDRMRRAKNGAPRQQRLNNFGGPAAKPAAPVARPAAPVSPEAKGAVHIRCLSSSQESLEQIRQLIKQNPGPTPVFLHIKNGEGEQVLNLGQGFTVRVTKLLLERLEELLGSEMAWLEE
jgi:DNA polymerase III alpha subunit